MIRKVCDFSDHALQHEAIAHVAACVENVGDDPPLGVRCDQRIDVVYLIGGDELKDVGAQSAARVAR